MKQRKNEPKVERAYTYRRELHRSDLLPALGAGFAVGAIAFYVATLFITIAMCSLASLLSIVKVLRLDPASVFKG